MTIEAHIATLEEKHGALEQELNTVKSNLSAGDEVVAEIKRKKLRIKDQIEKLKSSLH